ncbi:MAG: O-antigen ligase family protein [Bacteroidia bacterium]
MKFQFEKVYEYVLCLQVFSIICIPEISSILLALSIPVLITGCIQRKLNYSFNFNLLPFVLLYLTYALCIINTKHMDIALRYLEYKFVFIYIPLVFLFRPKSTLGLERIYKTIVYSASTISTYSIICSTVLFYNSNSFNSFYSSAFSNVHHPTYASLYFFTSLLILYYLPVFKKKSFKYCNMILALLGIYFCLSLAGFLFLFIWLLYLGISWLYTNGSIWLKWLLIPISVLFFYITFNYLPHVEGEWKNATWFAKSFIKNPVEFLSQRTVGLSGTEARIVLWTASFNIIMKHPWGVGTGNVDDVLSNELNAMKQYELAKKNYNPHNQYLQTAMEIGIPGLGILLWLLIRALIFARKHKHLFLFWFTLNLAFNMLFESILQKQSGIVFSTLVMCLIFVFSTTHVSNFKNKMECP